jgi:hypothetical protein
MSEPNGERTDGVPVMNAVRHIPLRWINADGPPAQGRARGLIALALVCTAIFAGFYAVGHATISTSTAQPAAAPDLPITYTGAAIPASLGDAPPIEAIALSRNARHSRSRPAGNARASAPSTTTITRPEAPSSPAPISTPAPAAAPTPTPAAGTPSHHSQSHSGGGVSFDSSG